MKDVYQYKADNTPASFKDADVKKGIVTGYFSHFDSLDSDGDIIRPGAFQKTILESGPNSARPRIKHLLNHDSNKPLGKLTELKEDSTGLYYESQVGTHALGQDFIKMIESGLISEHSIGFRSLRKNKGQTGNEITEVKLYEGSSLTAWGANMNTPLIGLKSEQKAEMASKRVELLTKALKDGTFTDETFDLLEIELKQLQQLFIDITTHAEKSPEPVKDDSIVVEQLKYINNLFKNN